MGFIICKLHREIYSGQESRADPRLREGRSGRATPLTQDLLQDMHDLQPDTLPPPPRPPLPSLSSDGEIERIGSF